MNLVHVDPPEMPEEGWFHDHMMKVLLGEETFNLMYPKRIKHHENRF